MAISLQSQQPLEPKTVAAVLADIDEDRARGIARSPAIPTGFHPLDRLIDGGVRPGELILLGGVPGVGKTICALQWARQWARAGNEVIYACYEHDERILLARLLTLEASLTADDSHSHPNGRLRLLTSLISKGELTIAEAVEQEASMEDAYLSLVSYASRLWLLRASGSHTGLEELARLVDGRRERPSVLVVDYLQKVSVRPEPSDETEKVTKIAEGLKELALSHDVAVLAVVAADKQGLAAPRLRLHHLRGSSALAYEADVALILNDKFHIVSKVHLAYDSVRAESFHQFVVFSIEKNRGGPALIDLEYRKNFESFGFDPAGNHVSDRLIDERIYLE